MFHLVHWGFTYDELKRMPIPDWTYYVHKLQEHFDNEAKAYKDAERGVSSSSTSPSGKEANPIGTQM